MRILLFFLLLPLSLWAGKLSLTEEAKVTIAADLAKVVFSVITEAKTPQHALEKNSEDMRSFQNYLANKQVPKEALFVRTVQLTPRYSFKEGSSNIDGYQAKNSIVLTTNNLPLLQTLLAEAPQKGINQIEELRFFSSQEKKMERLAITQAIQNGIETAKAAAAAAHATITDIESISILPQSPSSYPISFLLKGTSAEVPLPSTDITIQAQVEISFRLDTL